MAECPKCELEMPFDVEESAKSEAHHHCARCNAWQWGSGSGFDGAVCWDCQRKFDFYDSLSREKLSGLLDRSEP